MGKPLFPGEGELDQVTKIFRLLGAPTEDKWPGVTKLPHHNKISYKTPTRYYARVCYVCMSLTN